MRTTLPPDSADRAPASGVAQEVLGAHVAATNDRSARRLLATFTPDGVLTLMAPAVAGWRRDLHGTEIGSYFLADGPHHLRLAVEAAQHGSFVWARYADAENQGVYVLRLEGPKIAHAWAIEANRPVGME